MVRKLHAKPPDTGKLKKPKVLLFGKPAVGKTWVSLDFPKVYFIDTEGGADLPQYQRRLAAAGGVYLGKDDGSQDFNTIIEEIATLATVQHDFLTLVIDSFSMLYMLAAAQAEETVGSDYGADKRAANKPTRQLMLWLERLDMNVVLICHSKEKWARQGKQLYSEGLTFDGWDKMEYILDLCLQISSTGAKVHKTRLEGFPRESTFPWNFKEFEKRAGEGVLLRPPQTFKVATQDQVKEVMHLVATVKLESDWQEKVFAKAGVTSWSEMSEEKMVACLKMLRDKLQPGNPPPAPDAAETAA